MARNKSKTKPATFTMFNVTYEDGSITSNRRVENDRLDQSMGDNLLDLARTKIGRCQIRQDFDIHWFNIVRSLKMLGRRGEITLSHRDIFQAG